jgi:hypothetical protein
VGRTGLRFPGASEAFNRKHLCQIKRPLLCLVSAVNYLLPIPPDISAEAGTAAGLDPDLLLGPDQFTAAASKQQAGTTRTEPLLF